MLWLTPARPLSILWQKAQRRLIQFDQSTSPPSSFWSTKHHLMFSSTKINDPLKHNTKSTVFWCSRVVFGSNVGSSRDGRVLSGAILVNHLGIIEECFPGLSREEARSMSTQQPRHHSSSTLIVEGTDHHFIDLTENTTYTKEDGSRGRRGEKEEIKLCLSPGLIDVHTHISSLGRNWEGYTTATAAAAAGGITSIIGMPLNSIPPTVSVQQVDQELDYANMESTNLHVDVGLWGGVLPETAGEKQQLSDLLSHPNVLGLKAFLSPLPPGAGYQAISPTQLLDVAKLCGTYNKPILVHSELMTVEDQQKAVEEAYPDDGSLDDSHLAHCRSRPTKYEQDAVKVVIEASQFCDMHVVHLSDGIGCLPLIQQAQQQKMMRRRVETMNETDVDPLSSSQPRNLTVETCPHYLLFDTDQISSLGKEKNNGHQREQQQDDRRLKCFPPIREPNQRRRLWQGLIDGDIHMVASDHSPCEPSMRHDDGTSMKTAWGGLSGLQYQLPATWTAAQLFMKEVDDGIYSMDLTNDAAATSPRSNINDDEYTPIITEQDIAQWWSVAPSRLVGLDNDRGSIEPGKRADFVLWDTSFIGPPDSYVNEYHRWKGDCVYSTQQNACGRVLGTWLRGEQIYNGITDELVLPAMGEYIRCMR